MTEREQLPRDLVWSAGGHASDVALTALADGQSQIVPADVQAHVERCTTCTMHLGNVALLSLHTERELSVYTEVERASLRRPLPRVAIALGLLVAAAGAVPSVIDGRVHFFRDVPFFARALHTLALRLDAPGSTLGLFVTYSTALVLVAVALMVVRFLPQKETSR